MHRLIPVTVVSLCALLLVQTSSRQSTTQAPSAEARRAPSDVRGAKSSAISSALSVGANAPSVTLFVKGSTCSHCMSQIVDLDNLLAGRGIKVAVITADSEEELEKGEGQLKN